jgi:hypothetical protein
MICLLVFGFPFVCHANVIVYWRFEEGEGNYAYDSIGDYGHRLQFAPYYEQYNGWSQDVPVTVIPETGDINIGSIKSGGYIPMEGGTPIYLGSQFTIEGYFNLIGILRNSSILGFGGRFALSGLSLGFGNSPENDNEDTIRFYVTSDKNLHFSEPFDFVFDEWFHYAFVQNGDWGGVYINGELWWSFEGELSDSYAWGNWNDYEMNIGEGWGLCMDEFRISDEALRPDQFLCASSVPEPSTMALFGLGVAILARRRRKQTCE